MLPALQTFGRDLVRGFLHLLYPGICGACGVPLPPEQDGFCHPCKAALTADPFPACRRCAATIGPNLSPDHGCVHCRDISFHFERVIRLGPYDGLLRDVILRMKHGSGELLAERLADLWAERAEDRLRDLNAHVIIPVPLHWRRRWQRGYNQSETLAHGLADRLRRPCRPLWLRRVRFTPQQTRQTAADRRTNVRGAFRARTSAELSEKTILLVDDVLTTGSTASEAAAALRTAGAARVVVAVLARSHS